MEPKTYDNARVCAEDALRAVGKKVVLGLPLGIGKATHLANAFYDLALADPSIDLSIFTGLTLETPRAAPGLERRFLQPLVDRLFDGYVELSYAKARRDNRVPDNVHIREFFLQTASFLSNDYAQREYVSANYTHVTRRVLESGINVLAQMIARRSNGERRRYSLGSNPDLALDVIPAMRLQKDRPVRVLGEVNAQMPFMTNDAEVPSDWLDAVLEGPRTALFAVPAGPITVQEHAIALHTSALVKDGGTLQIGIGSLAEAISHALLLRHRNNPAWRRTIGSLADKFVLTDSVLALGGLDPFKQGLYACSELFSDGLLALLEQGIIAREVVDERNGRSLRRAVDSAFFLGSRDFYAKLRALDDIALARINMTSVHRVNELYGGETLKREQRCDARFINTIMEATALGGAASDALEDGRIVSGVGGQYNFVAMAHELEGGRSLLLLRATKMIQGHLRSTIVWERANETIPRHLKDIVVTEYGVADLRGATDSETVKRLLAVTDSRFQDGLLEAAKKARKLERSYQIPDKHRRNTPDQLQVALGSAQQAGLLPAFPFGTELTETEVTLAAALRHLKAQISGPRALMGFARTVLRSAPPPATAEPFLERMGLARATSLKERTMQRLVVAALTQTGALA